MITAPCCISLLSSPTQGLQSLSYSHHSYAVHQSHSTNSSKASLACALSLYLHSTQIPQIHPSHSRPEGLNQAAHGVQQGGSDDRLGAARRRGQGAGPLAAAHPVRRDEQGQEGEGGHLDDPRQELHPRPQAPLPPPLRLCDVCEMGERRVNHEP